MKRDHDRDRDATPHDQPEPYEVGYCKPPKASRFRPGQSGNPKGRPKGSRSQGSIGHSFDRLKKIVLDEAYRLIEVRDGDQMKKMTVAQAAMRSLGLKAAKGDARAQAMFFDLVSTIEASNSRDRLKTFEGIVEYKQNSMRDVAQRRALGLPEDDILPHPDTIHICPLSGRVVTTGPWTPEEQQMRRDMLQVRETALDTIRDAERKLRRRPGNAIELQRIATCERLIARIDDELPTLTRVILEGV